MFSELVNSIKSMCYIDLIEYHGRYTKETYMDNVNNVSFVLELFDGTAYRIITSWGEIFVLGDDVD